MAKKAKFNKASALPGRLGDDVEAEAEQGRERMQQIGADNFVGQHSQASGLEAKRGIQISSLWANECKTLR